MAKADFQSIEACRVCAGTSLLPLFSFGELSMTGAFPKSSYQKVPSGPLDLVKCCACDLVQLLQTYKLSEMYGDSYGYRSGLNPTMVTHLHAAVEAVLKDGRVHEEDIILDIGSNDGTLLSGYPSTFRNLIGIDPTAGKFRDFYPLHVRLIPDFFSASVFRSIYGKRKAQVITSFAMFYDLPAPLQFVREVESILSDDGVWIFEQSYFPSLLAMNSFDTICHEHLEYYGLKQIQWILQRAGMKISNVGLNDCNGGSFRVTARKLKSGESAEPDLEVQSFLCKEEMLLDENTFERFRENVESNGRRLREFLLEAKLNGKLVLGYGASTKGNVLLQHYGISSDLLPMIADVNEEKWGARTPGSDIPIISELDANAMRPDFKLILPWHFEKFFLEKEKSYLESGGRLVFPLPEFKVHEPPLFKTETSTGFCPSNASYIATKRGFSNI